MARRREAVRDDPYDDIIGWYRDALAQPAVMPWRGRRTAKPILLGPTWTTKRGRWVLPELTLGWDALAACGTWLKHDDGAPWRFTLEQARFVLWWYAIDDQGRFLWRDGVLQRLKGWGKDPVGACLLWLEAFGPCRFDGWDGDRPIVRDVSSAWVQTAAVSLEQTKNTMRLFPSLITAEARRHFGIQIGKELIHGLGDTRLIQAVTSSPATLEGARATFVLKNETHLWDSSNEGHEMAAVIDRNATKSPDGAARSLSITNAYEPAGDSSAQHDREAWEKADAGQSLTTGLLYDSVEAPPEAPLSADAAPGVVELIRGDSVWLDTPRIVQSILDTRNPPSQSRRWWYNQITASEDAWVEPREWDAIVDDFQPAVGDQITLGFDGSKSDDHTALIGATVDPDHLFALGIWAPNPQTNEIDRQAVDRAVRAAFEMYDVVGFYADVKEWESYIDQWAEDFSDQLVTKATGRQAVAWDMRARVRQFTDAAERLNAAIVESAAAVDTDQPRLTQDGSKAFRIHVLNARRAPNRYGVSVRKEHRESARKIDAVPAAVLARLARLDYLALPASRRRRKRSGMVW